MSNANIPERISNSTNEILLVVMVLQANTMTCREMSVTGYVTKR